MKLNSKGSLNLFLGYTRSNTAKKDSNLSKVQNVEKIKKFILNVILHRPELMYIKSFSNIKTLYIFMFLTQNKNCCWIQIQAFSSAIVVISLSFLAVIIAKGVMSWIRVPLSMATKITLVIRVVTFLEVVPPV